MECRDRQSRRLRGPQTLPRFDSGAAAVAPASLRLRHGGRSRSTGSALRRLSGCRVRVRRQSRLQPGDQPSGRAAAPFGPKRRLDRTRFHVRGGWRSAVRGVVVALDSAPGSFSDLFATSVLASEPVPASVGPRVHPMPELGRGTRCGFRPDPRRGHGERCACGDRGWKTPAPGSSENRQRRDRLRANPSVLRSGKRGSGRRAIRANGDGRGGQRRGDDDSQSGDRGNPCRWRTLR